jgi:hypothetical protein
MRTANAILPIAATLALAACGTGQQLAAGPVLGYVGGRGWSAGWEAGGGPMSTTTNGDPVPNAGLLLARAAIGMSWRPGTPATEARERITYLAWEPWFVVGGNLGVAHASGDGSFQRLVGVWEAAPWVVGAPRRSSPLYSCSPCYTVSLAIGWRWSGAGELYLAPKVGILNDTKMPWPFQTYAD